jgi:hypothetical protein
MRLNNTTKEQLEDTFHKHGSLLYKLLKINKDNVKYINKYILHICLCLCMCVKGISAFISVCTFLKSLAGLQTDMK